eukprot:COSAG02_NODE_55_length_43887_cov_30.660364_13_plen_97_part_00
MSSELTTITTTHCDRTAEKRLLRQLRQLLSQLYVRPKNRATTVHQPIVWPSAYYTHPCVPYIYEMGFTLNLFGYHRMVRFSNTDSAKSEREKYSGA